MPTKCHSLRLIASRSQSTPFRAVGVPLPDSIAPSTKLRSSHGGSHVSAQKARFVASRTNGAEREDEYAVNAGGGPSMVLSTFTCMYFGD